MSAEDSPSRVKVGGALGSLKSVRLLKKNHPSLDSSDSSTSSQESNKESSRNSSIDHDPAAATASFFFNSTRDFLAFLDIINKAMTYDQECVIKIDFDEEGIVVLVSSSRYLKIRKQG